MIDKYINPDDVIVNPEDLIEAYYKAFEGIPEIMPSQLNPEYRLAGTQITAEIWNDTINGLRSICANLIENIKAHKLGYEASLRKFVEEVNAYLLDALGEFSVEFADWLRTIQYFDVQNLGDGIHDYRLHFTFGTIEDPDKYSFVTPNLIQYNQIWIVRDENGDITPPPTAPKYNEDGTPVLDPDTQLPVMEECWVIKVDSLAETPEAPVSIELLRDLLGKVVLSPKELPVFSQLALLNKVLDPKSLEHELYNLGTVSRRLDDLLDTNLDQDRVLTQHDERITNLDKKLSDLGNLEDLAASVTLVNDVKNIKEVLDFENLFNDYLTGGKGTVRARILALETKVNDLSRDVAALQGSQAEQDKAIETLKAQNKANSDEIYDIQRNKLVSSEWKSLGLDWSLWNNWSYFCYREHNGFVNVRFWLNAKRTIHRGASVSWDNCVYLGRLPEHYRPDDHYNVEIACTCFGADNTSGVGHVEIVSINETVNTDQGADTDTDGKVFLREFKPFIWNGAPRATAFTKNCCIIGQATYIIRDKGDLKE